MILDSIFTCIATFAFGILFNIKGRNLIWASLGGGLSWFAYLLSLKLSGIDLFAFFIASVVAALFSEILAYVLKSPVITFFICAIIPLVPGGGMFRTMLMVVQKNMSGAIAEGIKTLSMAGIITIGVFLVSAIKRIVFRKKIPTNRDFFTFR